MHKTRVLLFLIALVTSTTYAQKNECKDFKTATYSVNGKVDIKKLQVRFEIFENIVKTKKTKRFIDQGGDDFTIFGLPIHSLDQKLKQMPKSHVCISSIAINNNNISSIFFSFKAKPEDQMVLKMNENFEYLSLEKVKFKLTGKIALKGDTVKVPIIMIGNYPFIEGEINGVKGRLMFDTGNAHTVSLHSKKLTNVKFKAKGSGHVGSGQTFTKLEYPLIEDLRIGNIYFDSIPNVDGNDMYYLEKISPSVIGQVGFDFSKGYDLKIDYLRSELTFYKHKKGLENWKDIKTKKNYITSIPYFTRTMENVPMFKMGYKEVEFLVLLDTGASKGIMIMEDENFNKFKNDGDIEDFYDEPSSLYDFHNIKINNDLTLDLYGLAKFDANPPFNKPLGITEKNTLTLAYSFFSRYTTIWDTQNKIIHVFENK